MIQVPRQARNQLRTGYFVGYVCWLWGLFAVGMTYGWEHAIILFAFLFGYLALTPDILEFTEDEVE